MLVRRLLVLIGVLVGVAGLYLREIETDSSLVEAIGGTGLPTIWQSFSSFERIAVVVGVGLLVVIAYRWKLGAVPDRIVAVIGGLLAGAAMVMLFFAFRDARGDATDLRELLDLAVFSDLIPESPGARAGSGFLISIAGFGVVGVASLWDLFARRVVPATPARPAGSGPAPRPRTAAAPAAGRTRVAQQTRTRASTRQPTPQPGRRRKKSARTSAAQPQPGPLRKRRRGGKPPPAQRSGTAPPPGGRPIPPQQRTTPNVPPAERPSVDEPDGAPVEGSDSDE
jgi:hypothetical protein